MMGRKYKLLKGEMIANPFIASEQLKVYRIKALRDIPEHFVFKGDIGGYVTDKMTLSHEGGCWVGGDAIVHGASVTGNALVSGKAIVYAGIETTSEVFKKLGRLIDVYSREKPFAYSRITVADNAVITENAIVTAFEAERTYINPVKIRGNAYIGGVARLNAPAVIEGDVIISDHTNIGVGAKVSDSVEITDRAEVGRNVTIGGDTKLSGDASIAGHCMISGNLHLAGRVKIAEYTKISNTENLFLADDVRIEPGSKILKAEKTTGNVEKDAINSLLSRVRQHPSMERATQFRDNRDSSPVQTAARSVNSLKLEKYKKLLNETLSSINSYETDIVKIIKYPVMVDRTDDYTAAMLRAKRAVSLVDPETEESDFYAAVLELDKSFHAAEANAVKISSSRMNPEEQKKTQKAQDLFSVAINAASTENEKINAFKQGLKQLEGIILVPDKAVTALRVKAGIAALEA